MSDLDKIFSKTYFPGKKCRVFFMCTHPNQGTGYARVSNKITNYLADLKNEKKEYEYEVVYFAFQNYKDQAISDRYISPRIKFIDAFYEDPKSPKGFGDNAIVPNLIREKPDILFIYNDICVISAILEIIPGEILKKMKIVLYIDIVYEWENISVYKNIQKYDVTVITFLECWRKHLVEEMKIFPVSNVHVMKHGIDFEKFQIKKETGENYNMNDQDDRKLLRKISREKLKFRENDFIVVNMNRNSSRKQWDLTIRSFLKFLSEQSEAEQDYIKLFCGCLLNHKEGYNLLTLIENYSHKYNLDYDKIIISNIFINHKPLHLTDEEVANIYACANVGMNTCNGEGFGLTTLEGLYFRTPQIVPKIPALEETLGKFNDPKNFVEVRCATCITNAEKHGGELAQTSVDDYTFRLNQEYILQREGKYTNFVEREFIEEWDWDIVMKDLNLILKYC